MRVEPQRGDIWLVDWSPARGSEQEGFRPALVVQTNAANLNPAYPNNVVLAISTKGKPVSFHIPVEPNEQNGLKQLSTVKCERILTISKGRLVRRLGSVDTLVLSKVAEAVKQVLELW